jgi:hypothetical protein
MTLYRLQNTVYDKWWIGTDLYGSGRGLETKAVGILGLGTEQEGKQMWPLPLVGWHTPRHVGTCLICRKLQTETLAAVGWSRDIIWGCGRDAATKLGVEMKTTYVTDRRILLC